MGTLNGCALERAGATDVSTCILCQPGTYSSSSGCLDLTCIMTPWFYGSLLFWFIRSLLKFDVQELRRQQSAQCAFLEHILLLQVTILPHDIPCLTNLCWQADLMIGAIASTTCSLCDAGTYSSSSGKAYYYYSPFHFRKLAVRTMRTCIPLFFLKTFAHLLLAGSMASSLCTLCTAGTYSTASGFDLAFNKILCHTYFYFLA